jgi:hypothetical protein
MADRIRETRSPVAIHENRKEMKKIAESRILFEIIEEKK